ncbi:MAG TPA: nuclear transport factor 2 family protein [Saprospiraceae bacterium]|nr:nuclear transport factor 2 family protein [Saprospiraceae bacterium]HPI06065.1 nuclear transport factor 2 family protein [Saprospiraceae bacterium]
MRYGFTLLLLHFFLFSFAQNSAHEKILQTELRRFAAMTQKDTVVLKQLLSDDLMYIHSNSLQENKSAHLGNIAAGTMVYQKMSRGKVQVRRYGKLALTNGDVQVQGLLKDAPFEVHLAYTAVYKKKKKTWQLVNWQSTRIP